MFKELFTESPMISKKIKDLIQDGSLPITDKVSYNLGFGDITQTFHATDLEHLENLKRTGKSKKSISTFTRGLQKLIGPGMLTNPDVIAKLEGNAMIELESDAFSVPDGQGRRWIDLRNFEKIKGVSFLMDALKSKAYKTIYGFSKNSLVYPDYDMFEKFIKNPSFFDERWDELTNKEKSKVISIYIVNAENLMSNTMYSKIINKVITRNSTKYDEILMNKFKVLGVYSIENGRFAFNHENAQSIIEDMGYKYLGHIPKSEFKNVTPETY